MQSPSISIITATYNSAATIADCLTSVASQTWPCEHIIIDGASTDNTLEIVRRVSSSARIFSEPDDGIYDAMTGMVHGYRVVVFRAKNPIANR